MRAVRAMQATVVVARIESSRVAHDGHVRLRGGVSLVGKLLVRTTGRTAREAGGDGADGRGGGRVVAVVFAVTSHEEEDAEANEGKCG